MAFILAAARINFGDSHNMVIISRHAGNITPT